MVSLTWGLDKSVDTALSVARGVFLAANNDNVQPLAIVSCEKFGTTIAMCPDTCRKVEMLTARTPEPVAINFIRAYAGFDAADCATQLSKSQAGVQFLGLAAALVTSLEAFEGGNSLHGMLTSSASDKSLLPTTKQLKELLQSLEPRLMRSGFLNTVIGWHVFLTHSPAMNENQAFLQEAKFYPNSKGIDGLVDAFRQLSRIGEADITKVSVRTQLCAPWVIAFTKWCLGLPPSIYLSNGKAILEQPGSKVDVNIAEDDIIIPGISEPDVHIRISIHRAIGAPSDLVEAEVGKQWKGMVNVKEFGQWRLHQTSLNIGMANRALLEALPSALRQIIQCLRYSDYTERGSDTLLLRGSIPSPKIDEELTALGLSPFPEDRVIAQTMSRYLANPDMTIPPFLTGLLIADLPVVAHHLATCNCLCNKCKTAHLPKTYQRCNIDGFYHSLATVCADILALSLFGNTEPPLLALGGFVDNQEQFVKGIRTIISSGKIFVSHLACPFNYALEMVGHAPQGSLTTSIMSSNKGQVIYPRIYETLCYEKNGYLILNWLPGLLRYGGEAYTRILSGHCVRSPTRFKVLSGIPVEAPRYLMPQARLFWQVEQRDDFLEALLGLKGSLDYRETAEPGTIFERLSSALLLEACAHDADATLESPDAFCAFTSPTLPEYSDSKGVGIQTIGIVAVDGSNEMRLLSLAAKGSAHRGPFVLRKKACLACCLAVCRRTGYSVLVL